MSEHVEEPGVWSASQLETASRCMRLWGFQYIARIRVEGTRSTSIGGRMHRQLEGYLQGEPLDFTEPDDIGIIAASGIHHLPAPRTPGMRVEGYFKFQSPETGMWYRGAKDVVLDPDPPGRPHPVVIDHKSSSNIQAWAKTPEVLKTDIQANIYAYHELLRWPGHNAVDLKWVYYQTRGPKKSEPREVTLTRAHVSDQMRLIELGAARLLPSLMAKIDPMSIPAEQGPHCRAYGGCPFEKTHCKWGPEFAFTGIGTPKMSQNAPVNTGSLLSKLLKEPVPHVEFTEVDVPAREVKGTISLPIGQMFSMPETDQPINPPESALPPAQPVGLATEASVVEDKPRRGRKPGSKNKHVIETVTAAEVPYDSREIDQIAAELKEKGVSIPPPAVVSVPAPASYGLILFVNCAPDNATSAMRAEALIAQAHAEIKEREKVGDYRFISYGQGAGMLSARVAELAVDQAAIILDTTTPEGNVCKDALVAAATNVVRGFR